MKTTAYFVQIFTKNDKKYSPGHHLLWLPQAAIQKLLKPMQTTSGLNIDVDLQEVTNVELLVEK